MILANVHGAIQLARTGQRAGDAGQSGAFEQLHVGEQVVLNVVRRVDQRTFLVSFGGEQHVMDSSVNLAVGGRVHAVVVAVGDRLELRYVDTAPASAAQGERDHTVTDTAAPPPQTLVSTLGSRYRVTLRADEHSRLEQAVAGAADPTAMALGGLFLAKLGVDLNEPALQAMYDVQHGQSVSFVPQSIAHRDISALVEHTGEGEDESTQDLAGVIGDSVPEAAAQMMSFDAGAGDAGSGQSDARDTQELAKLFLNIQDGGSVGYRYGTLPVIVGGQLVELEMVVLQQRHQREGSGPVRRLSMSLRTESFGQVRIDARSLENRLIVTFTGESPRSADELAAYSGDLRNLLNRLGWNVEGIGYQLDAQPVRAARQIVDHVLSAGTVDMVF